MFHLFGAILLCLIVCVALIVVSGLALYVYPNFKDRRALEKCKNEEDVVAYFQREPEIVYRSLDKMTYMEFSFGCLLLLVSSLTHC